MTQSVLFVGNSYTFYNDVPEQVAALAALGGHAVTTDKVVQGGADVRLHWEVTGARARIERGGIDVLVLQDQSGGPLHDRARFEAFAPRLAAAGIEAGARIVWYQTWARAAGHEAYEQRWSGGSPKEMTRLVRNAYLEMAGRAGGDVSPVGDAWHFALEQNPGLTLHDADLHHAAPAGSHLAALVLSATIAGVSPLAARFSPEDVDDAVLDALRTAAHRAVTE